VVAQHSRFRHFVKLLVSFQALEVQLEQYVSQRGVDTSA
jgi:hypothetical protein